MTIESKTTKTKGIKMNNRQKMEKYVNSLGILDYINEQMNDPDNMLAGPYSPRIFFNKSYHDTILKCQNKEIEIGDFDCAFDRCCKEMKIMQNNKNAYLFNRIYYKKFEYYCNNYDRYMKK